MTHAQWERPVKLEIPCRAVPGYLSAVAFSETEWCDVPPGHRFQLYFHGWADFGELRYRDEDHWKKQKDRVREAASQGNWSVLEKEGGVLKSRGPLKDKKRVALEAACGMGVEVQKILKALEARGAALAGGEAWTCDVRLLAPLATGLGLPHPVENGFSFCPPYGVPFLAGSAVKGVFRRAAELAGLEEESPWNPVRVWALFGFDATAEWFDPAAEACEGYLAWCAARWSSEVEVEAASWVEVIRPQLPKRWRDKDVREIFRAFAGNGSEVARSVHWGGLLVFHDAFPSPNAEMGVDILNPHHKEYYSGQSPEDATPDDAENPVPVYFLVLKPGCRLTLRVSWAMREGKALVPFRNSWQSLLEEIAEPAVRDLGLGAKTRVGYGYGELDVEAAEARSRAIEELRRAEELARHPWREFLPRLRKADNWGELRQMAEGPLAEHLGEAEVAEVVEEKARQMRKKKWDADRDRMVADWLARAGREWETVPAMTGGEDESGSEHGGPGGSVSALQSWEDYLQLSNERPLESMELEELLVLRGKFRAWGYYKKKVKAQKKKHVDRLEALLREKRGR